MAGPKVTEMPQKQGDRGEVRDPRVSNGARSSTPTNVGEIHGYKKPCDQRVTEVARERESDRHTGGGSAQAHDLDVRAVAGTVERAMRARLMRWQLCEQNAGGAVARVVSVVTTLRDDARTWAWVEELAPVLRAVEALGDRPELLRDWLDLLERRADDAIGRGDEAEAAALDVAVHVGRATLGAIDRASRDAVLSRLRRAWQRLFELCALRGGEADEITDALCTVLDELHPQSALGGGEG